VQQHKRVLPHNVENSSCGQQEKNAIRQRFLTITKQTVRDFIIFAYHEKNMRKKAPLFRKATTRCALDGFGGGEEAALCGKK